MEVGELRIVGNIDTLNIEKGINGIIVDMKKVDTTSQSVNSDFERMYANTNRLAAALGLVGASAALINLAKGAPQVAPAMASIQMSMLKLQLAVGQALAPMFNWFADKLNGLAGWAQEHPDLFGVITKSVVGLGIAVGALTLGKGIVTLFGWFTDIGGLTAGSAIITGIGTALEWIGGLSLSGIIGALATVSVWVVGIGVALAGVVALWGYVNNLAAQAKAFRTMGGASPQGVQDMTGNMPYQQRGTRVVMPNMPSGTDFNLQRRNVSLNNSTLSLGF